MRLIAPADAAHVTDLVDLDVLYGGPRPVLPDRPWVALCMIASLDGAITVGGVSGGLGNDADHAVFRTLRRAADVILVGAKTASAEGYGPPAKRGQRIGVVTASGTVDTGTELFTSGSGFLVMPEDGAAARPGVDVVRAGVGAVDLPTALRRLDAVAPGATFVQAEGGPRLNGNLLDAGCVDELNLTLAAAFVGGPGGRIVAGAEEAVRRFELAHALVDDDDYLFTRWVRRDRAC